MGSERTDEWGMFGRKRRGRGGMTGGMKRRAEDRAKANSEARTYGCSAAQVRGEEEKTEEEQAGRTGEGGEAEERRGSAEGESCEYRM